MSILISKYCFVFSFFISLQTEISIPKGVHLKSRDKKEMKDRIMHIMKEAGMSQADFSKATGIPAASLSSIFTGRTAPTMKHAEAIHRYCPTLSLSWLLFGEGEMHVGGSEDVAEGQENDFEQDPDFSDENGIDFYPGNAVSGDAPYLDQSSQGDHLGSPTRGTQLQNVRARVGERPMSKAAQERQNMSRFQHADVMASMCGNNAADTNVNLYKPNKKIIEIRIFFDDGTFETFQGNQ